jgi:MSHA pilin protein MshD
MIRPFGNDSGFTLIELVLTIVLLGFVSLILIPFVQSIGHSPDPMLRQRAVALGQALMDEVLAKRWDENTPVGGGPICSGESSDNDARDTLVDDCADPGSRRASVIQSVSGASNPISSDGEPRDLFDDVDDYDGFSETTTFRNQNGEVVATLAGYSRSVAVRYIPSHTDPIEAATPVGTTAGGNNATDTKRIVVTVTSPLNETFTLVAVSCNF